MFDILDTFISFNKKHQLFNFGDSILVALSGGVDSVVLLHLLHRLMKEWGLKIHVAHLNHMIRGEESDGDELFVIELCAKWDVPCTVNRRDVPGFQKKEGISVEMAAREVRYKFLDEVAREQQCRCIAIAHNANDQAETVLDHLMRGSGITGLSGMPVKRDHYIRPLLFATRDEIERYAQEQALSFQKDSSNEDVSYKRNRIRHNLIHIIEEQFNPRAVSALNKVSSIMTEADEYLDYSANEALKHCIRYKDRDKIILDIIEFLAYFNILQKYVLRKALKHLGRDERLLNFKVFEKIRLLLEKRRYGTFLDLGQNVQIRLSPDELVIGTFHQHDEEIQIDSIPFKSDLWDGWNLEINRDGKPLDEIVKNSDLNVAWVDEDCLQGTLKVRTLREGDRFYPLNFKGSKKLSDFFIDKKIPFYERQRIPVLECRKGIVWLCGFRLDDRFKVTTRTKRVLNLKLSRNIESSFRV